MAAHLLAVVNGSSIGGKERRVKSPLRRDFCPSQTVLLTGTTGSLGAYMLDMMCSSPQVKKIVALNRGSDGGRSRQPGVSGERGLSQDFSKVEFVQADLSKPRLGVEEKMYNNLLHEADRIIHNAWPVNFNISVGSFEPHIKGVRHFVDFAAAAKKHDEVPETGFTDLNLPTMGYGRSKAVSSLILDEAREVWAVDGGDPGRPNRWPPWTATRC
ncbi:male sterility protein [Hirsutella rhossiliensis]|uniref:Male sterility protein n=1 Tax=Hirsutella rhossiliensis TaxID=111463 RepID=A0A9P8MKW6_9HYPO|nr:male sterility protein [Hirsutella rhossiliensis]KAH0956940.1 male sterility protein [Hirsutella rhossiliensis]